MVDALKGGAADIRGNITPGSLYAYVDEALGHGNNVQCSKLTYQASRRCERLLPKIPLETIRKITTYFSTPDAEHSLNPSYEDITATQSNRKQYKNFQRFAKVSKRWPSDSR